MPTPTDLFRRLPSEDWAKIEPVLKAFEAALRRGERPPIEEFLPQGQSAALPLGSVLIVQRNVLPCLPQGLPPSPLSPSVPPRAGMALARPPVPPLPPGREVQRPLQRIARRFRGQEDLQ